MAMSSAMKIAIIDSNENEARLLLRIIEESGHVGHLYKTGKSFMDASCPPWFDLIILDWSLPDVTGLNILDWVKTVDPRQPFVLLLTGDSYDEQVFAGLYAGADDYTVRPIRLPEFTARLQSFFRRYKIRVNREADDANMFEIGPYRFYLSRKIVQLDSQPVLLKPKEFAIAALLFRNAGQTVLRRTIAELVWRHEIPLTSRTLDTHISQVRKKLSIDMAHNATLRPVQSIGYRLDVF
ncbi:response regulator transcription factor [Oxalicibacterium sp.]|uniref:response regulator transcription factor n=1 Tax=Oxalicibacterium sp. TaxID=2766525 RepID=UPI002D7EF0B0|nr:response regulator transcription factor [Oxalicibacterium sp.]